MHTNLDVSIFLLRKAEVKCPEFAVLRFLMKLFNYRRTLTLLTCDGGTSIFTARRYAKRGICRRRVSVCLCVCLSHSGIVSKQLNVGSRKQRHTIAP